MDSPHLFITIHHANTIARTVPNTSLPHITAPLSLFFLQDDEVSPEDLAAVDPLAGWMATEPLHRMRFLLQHRCGSTAFVGFGV
jgi:hypothetical protein